MAKTRTLSLLVAGKRCREPVLHDHLGQGQLATLGHGGFHSLADGDHEAEHVVAQTFPCRFLTLRAKG